jgi:hypothetical protein
MEATAIPAELGFERLETELAQVSDCRCRLVPKNYDTQFSAQPRYQSAPDQCG